MFPGIEIGGWLMAALGLAAGVVAAVYLYLVAAPVVRRWTAPDLVQRTRDLRERDPDAVPDTLDDRLHRALSPPPDVVQIDADGRPPPVLPGVEAVPGPR